METISTIKSAWPNLPASQKNRVYCGVVAGMASLAFMALGHRFELTASRLIRGSVGGTGLALSFYCLNSGLRNAADYSPSGLMLKEIKKHDQKIMTIEEIYALISSYKTYASGSKSTETVNQAMATVIGNQIVNWDNERDAAHFYIFQFESLFRGLLMKKQFQDDKDTELRSVIFPQAPDITPERLSEIGNKLYDKWEKFTPEEDKTKLFIVLTYAEQHYKEVIPDTSQEKFRYLMEDLRTRMSRKW